MTYAQYRKLARHIFDWPSNPHSAYPNFPGLKKFLGTWKPLPKRLVKEWHPTKNGSLKPTDVTPGSNKKVSWKCRKCRYEWEATVCDRAHGNGCPYCSGKRVNKENCLATKNPELVKEWHPTKNGSLKPTDVMPNSSKKFWWQCNKGHEWEAPPSRRVKGHGCPYCSGRYATKENCLATKNPELVKEWHPTKNGSLKPIDVTPNSHVSICWKCENRGHEWEAPPSRRVKGHGCPHCYKLKRKS